jgi:uncharacterized peroxidase-related enzyme
VRVKRHGDHTIEEPMARVPTHSIDDAPSGSQDTLKALEERFGTVLNLFGAMAHAPAVIQLFAAAEQTLQETSSLDRRTREAIHLAVAEVNECDYCRAAYTGAAKQAGLSDEQTIAIRRGELDEPALSALLDVAREIAANRGHVDDRTWQTARDAGWSDEQLLEAFADTVRTILTNYFNHVAQVDLDLPPAPSTDR